MFFFVFFCQYVASKLIQSTTAITLTDITTNGYNDTGRLSPAESPSLYDYFFNGYNDNVYNDKRL